jgi:hypothetical protein
MKYYFVIYFIYFFLHGYRNKPTKTPLDEPFKNLGLDGSCKLSILQLGQII